MNFATIGLSDKIVQTVADRGYEEPTPIQLDAIPIILEGPLCYFDFTNCHMAWRASRAVL